MNHYPAWLNWLVFLVLVTGTMLALPNIYGSAPAVQVASADGAPFDDAKVEQIDRILDAADLSRDAIYLHDGRVVVRFNSVEDQLSAGDRLRDRIGRDSTVALTLSPKLPGWVRNAGQSQRSLQ